MTKTIIFNDMEPRRLFSARGNHENSYTLYQSGDNGLSIAHHNPAFNPLPTSTIYLPHKCNITDFKDTFFDSLTMKDDLFLAEEKRKEEEEAKKEEKKKKEKKKEKRKGTRQTTVSERFDDYVPAPNIGSPLPLTPVGSPLPLMTGKRKRTPKKVFEFGEDTTLRPPPFTPSTPPLPSLPSSHCPLEPPSPHKPAVMVFCAHLPDDESLMIYFSKTFKHASNVQLIDVPFEGLLSLTALGQRCDPHIHSKIMAACRQELVSLNLESKVSAMDSSIIVNDRLAKAIEKIEKRKFEFVYVCKYARRTQREEADSTFLLTEAAYRSAMEKFLEDK